MPLRILAVGKKHEAWVQEGITRYEKRLVRPFTSKWLLIAHSARSGDEARQDESEQLLSKLRPDEVVILLDERGKLYDSPALAGIIEQTVNASRMVVFIIGGAYGVSQALQERADYVWSLSPLVFPHQLVRLLLTEQIYRSQAIILGHPYHHT